MIVVRLVAGLGALLVAVPVVRSAAVQQFALTDPKSAADFWADHPTVQISRAMVGIAEATRDRRPVGQDVFQLTREAAVKAPLEPEPFLVRGVQAQLAGRPALAEHAFRAAQRRDPRSLPAAYFLASHYVATGNVDRGLVQVATLARLAPGGVKSVAPYVAAFARDRANWPRLRALFRADPDLRDQSLEALAADAANADIALALADPSWRAPDRPWVRTLLWSLVRAGEYRKARAIWAQVSGVRLAPDRLIVDPDFSTPDPPPPFNWQLISDKSGLAERKPGGRLQLIFHGQNDGTLAYQLLLLPPGRYRLNLRMTGDREQAQALVWALRCDKPSRELSRASIDQIAARGWSFDVPAGCEAQWLELKGIAGEMPKRSEVTISGLTLIRGASGA